MEILVSSKNVSKEKIFLSFFDLSNLHFNSPWTKTEEKNLQHAKNMLNSGNFLISSISDVRILSQLVIDFLESLKGENISRATLRYIRMTIKSSKKVQNEDKSILELNDEEISEKNMDIEHKTRSLQKRSRVDKNEVYLMLRIKNFLTNILTTHNTSSKKVPKRQVALGVARICLALINIETPSKEYSERLRRNEAIFKEVPNHIIIIMELFQEWIREKQGNISMDIQAGTSPMNTFSKKVGSHAQKPNFAEATNSISNSLVVDDTLDIMKSSRRLLQPMEHSLFAPGSSIVNMSRSRRNSRVRNLSGGEFMGYFKEKNSESMMDTPNFINIEKIERKKFFAKVLAMPNEKQLSILKIMESIIYSDHVDANRLFTTHMSGGSVHQIEA